MSETRKASKNRIYWPDIYRAADVWVEGDDGVLYGMGFKLYELTEALRSGVHEVEDEPDFHGFIKWDGCANFQGGQRLMIHICGVHEVNQIAEAFRRLYKEAAARLPNWDGE